MDRRRDTHKWLIIFTVMIGSLMASLDVSIVNVAMPQMRGTLGASIEEMTSISTGYILSAVIIMPLTAFLSSRFGRKRFYMFSVGLFTAASACCGLAWNLESMIVFRVLQGAGGGILVPVAQAILREILPSGERGQAMGIYGFGVVLGPAIGPALGGWLTDHWSWPWIFYINLPFGILSTMLVMRFIEDPPHLVRRKGKPDFAGIVFLMFGLGAFQIMLEKGPRNDWLQSEFILYTAVVSCVGLVLFAWRELTADHPAVDLRIFKNRNFALATFVGGILSLCLFGSLFILPFFLQNLLHYPAYDSGLAVLPRTVFMAFSLFAAGKLYSNLGPRWMILIGTSANVVSFFQFSCFSLDVGYWDLFFPQCLQGLGFGFIFVAVSAAAMSNIEKKLLISATGLYNVVRQVCGSIGIALSGTLLTQGEEGCRNMLIRNVTAYKDTATELLSTVSSHLVYQGADPVTAKDMALKLLDGIVMKHASMLSFNKVFFVITVLFLLSMPLIPMMNDVRFKSRNQAT